ncbi:MAG: 50S ribosomal protein L19 [Candidatus Peribacteria bacterium]|nr:MAG: 50S ribosomal protein L19 [Candidatus Peribacteria bacterium]
MNTTRLQHIFTEKGYHVLPVKPGMVLEIHEKVGDGNNQRIWKFKGTVLRVKKPNQPDGTFLVRGEVARTIVEKIYPLSFDKFEKVLLVDQNKTRKSKLYHLRDKVGKRAAKLKSIIKPEQRNTDLYAATIATKKAAAPTTQEETTTEE